MAGSNRLSIVVAWLCVLAGACLAEDVKFDYRILGGDEAESPYQFPYHVYLTLGHGKYICGGGIIGEQHILTAAHCVMKSAREFHDDVLERGLQIIAGTSTLRDLRSSHAIVRKVEKIYVPRGFDEVRVRGDLAVLKLKEPLGQIANVGRLELPLDQSSSYAGYTAVITGFGYTRHWSPVEDRRQSNLYAKVSDNLKYLQTKVLDQQLCMAKQLNQPSNTIICAQADQSVYNYKDFTGTCKGDSGGPLVVQNRYVIGVASHTINTHKCSEWYVPSFYTSTAIWKPFIELAMKDQTTNMITKTF